MMSFFEKIFGKGPDMEDVKTCYSLGCRYMRGDRVEQNYTKAAELFGIAAKQGHFLAQYALGVLYSDGKGVEQDSAEALKWWKRAAEQGHAPAQYNVGLFYDSGEGGRKEPAEAVKWYKKAAEQGHAPAQCKMADCYRKGSGVEQDSAEAAKWYRKAAEQGVVSARFNLGVCYFNGDGVKQDPMEGLKWWQKAAKQGHAEAQQLVRMYDICLEPDENEEDEKEPSRAEMQAEAIARMESLQLYDGMVEGYRENGRVCVSEPPYGAFYWLEPEEEKLVQALEQAYGCLVYVIVRSFGKEGTTDCLLYVSGDRKLWPIERGALQFWETDAFVVYRSAPESSAFRHIGIGPTEGAGLCLAWQK